MSCTRCQVVPDPVTADYVLFATPHPSTRDKILAHLEAAGAEPRATELGVKASCAGKDWGTLVQVLAAAMSEPERTDTRVAVVPRTAGSGDDPTALYKAVFQSRSVREVLSQLDDSWLYDVLRKDRICVHFHPLVRHEAAGAPALFAYECLMRGLDAEGKLIGPGKMFSAARSLDMLFLLDQKCRLASVRHAAGLGAGAVNFFINFLPTAIYNPEHCLQTTLAAVKSCGIDPGRITFEVVETEHVGDYDHLKRVLQFYRDRGFRVALDDVGAGYSSLLSLCQLRPDYIKLDGEFVRMAAKGALEGKIVRDLADAARQNGITCIAEGVETEDDLAFAIDAGIPITQGYVHCKPAPKALSREEAAAVLRRVADVSRRPRPRAAG